MKQFVLFLFFICSLTACSNPTRECEPYAENPNLREIVRGVGTTYKHLLGICRAPNHPD